MRIVFIGTVAFSRRCLEELLDAGTNVVAVLTFAPARGAGHGDYADLAPLADERGVPVLLVDNVNDPDTVEYIRALRPDLIFVLGWSQLIGEELLQIAPAIGSHPALLPRDRGRNPITWALADGYTETGLTFLWLDEGADGGDILWQGRVEIDAGDDAASLYAKIEELAAVAIRDFLPQLESGAAPRTPQDASRATYRRKRTDADRWIDWTLPSKAVHDLVRSLARPYVGALTRCRGQDVLVWKTRVEVEADTADAAPGAVLDDGAVPLVRTGDGAVSLLDVEPAGVLRVGDILERPR